MAAHRMRCRPIPQSKAGVPREIEFGAHWTYSYRLINLCECYRLLADSSVLPATRYYAQAVSWAQYRSGSWSHGGG
jgi:hypothetical protein